MMTKQPQSMIDQLDGSRVELSDEEVYTYAIVKLQEMIKSKKEKMTSDDVRDLISDIYIDLRLAQLPKLLQEKFSEAKQQSCKSEDEKTPGQKYFTTAQNLIGSISHADV